MEQLLVFLRVRAPLGIHPWALEGVRWINYTPPESPVLQLSHLPTSSLSEEGGFSRKWELSTPSSTQPSQSSSLPLLGPAPQNTLPIA